MEVFMNTQNKIGWEIISDDDDRKKYVDRFVDDEGNLDDKLSLNEEGFACLTDDLEKLVDKYTGIKDSSFGKCAEIRTDIIFLIDDIVNKEVNDE